MKCGQNRNRYIYWPGLGKKVEIVKKTNKKNLVLPEKSIKYTKFPFTE